MAVTIETLIRKQRQEMAGFRTSIASLEGKPDTSHLVGSLQFRIAQAERAVAILEATQWRYA
jgi:hypothetical protein